jgi:tetratricopeptide (TPR) repeat protein
LKLAELLSKKGEWGEVVTLLQKALDNEAACPRIHSRLAAGYAASGQRGKAIETLRLGVARYPNHAGLASNLAWMLLEQGGRLEEAFSLAQKAYSLAPEDPAVADTFGWAFYKRGLYTRAIWLFEQALQSEPNHPLVNYHLGLVRQSHGQQEQAVSALAKALQLGLSGPERVNAQQVLASLRESG